MRFHVSFDPALDRPDEEVEAEAVEQQGLHWAFLGTHVVMNRSRPIVVRRLPMHDVLRIHQST